MKTGWRGLALLASAAMAACQATVPRPVDFETAWPQLAERADRVTRYAAWRLSGRLAIDGGEEGGSGRLDWAQDGERGEMAFRGALGRGAWQMEYGPAGARLETASGTVEHGASVNEIAARHLGWSVPVNALEWWVRGLPAQGQVPTGVALDAEGLPVTFMQHGWRVSFSRYQIVDGLALPGRLDAEGPDGRVRLVVSDWRLGAAGDELPDDGRG